MVLPRAFTAWLLIVAVETVHGILRTLLPEGKAGVFVERQHHRQ